MIEWDVLVGGKRIGRVSEDFADTLHGNELALAAAQEKFWKKTRGNALEVKPLQTPIRFRPHCGTFQDAIDQLGHFQNIEYVVKHIRRTMRYLPPFEPKDLEFQYHGYDERSPWISHTYLVALTAVGVLGYTDQKPEEGLLF